MRAHRAWLAVSVLLTVQTQDVRAAPPSNIDVETAMAFAAKQHPAVAEDAATVQAATAQVDVERAKYWPQLEVFAQLDRSTSNTVSGALFAVPNLPVVGGAPGRVFDAGNFGVAAGATAAWDALGFKRWDASIDQAKAEARAAHVDEAARALELEYRAADLLIVAVERDEAVKAAEAGVERATVFMTTVKAAVEQNLRPGADMSRAQAELAMARTALIRAQSTSTVSIAQLAEALGAPDAAITVNPGALLALPPRPTLAGDSRTDPRIAAAEARIEAEKAHKRAVETGTLPKLDVVAALWGRANGADMGGVRADGLVPDVPNWALGVVLTWPVFIGKTIGPQARVESALIERDQAREREIAQTVHSQLIQARAVIEGAYRVAESTPVALQAAREAEQQANARYQAKLDTADDVAQAQRLLEQAEIDDAVARLDVWRAILLATYATGDLTGFSTLYHAAGG